MADDDRPSSPIEDEPGPIFEGPSDDDTGAESRRRSEDPLFTPAAHTEVVDPALCRTMVIASVALSVLGVFTHWLFCLVALGVAATAYGLRERRFAAPAMWLAVGAVFAHLLLHMCSGCMAGGKGLVGAYERLM